MKTLKTHKHWFKVEELCQRIKAAGFEAVLAGGCVRDGLLGRSPQDFDVATSASPDQIEALFPRTIAIGKAFGVIKVLLGDEFQIEVATFRSDGPYKDGRRPSHVEFSDIKEDAKRRDFTINALFYSIAENRVIDFVGGQKDLELKTIRTVGDPRQRFEEDKLRPLRALRFSAQLDFEIEQLTWAAIVEYAPRISVVSAERVQEELKKLFKLQGQWQGLLGLIETGMMDNILPEFRSWNDKQKLKRLESLTQQMKSNSDFAVALSRLVLSARGLQATWPDVESALRRLKCSNEVIMDVLYYLKAIFVLEEEQSRLASKLKLLGHENSPLLLELWTAWRLVNKAELKPVDDVIQSYRSIADAKGHLPKPFLTGEDLIRKGKVKGPMFGALLQEIYDLQLEGLITSRQEALAKIN